jgi:hypothetical protein
MFIHAKCEGGFILKTGHPFIPLFFASLLLGVFLAAMPSLAWPAGAQSGAAKPSADPGMLPPGASQTGNPNLATPVVPPLIIIAPTEVRTDPKLGAGCWVRLFPEPNFKGVDDLTVAGPIELASLHNPAGGVYWKHKAESVLVGPKATVSVYENQSFRDHTATLKPGTQEPQLRSALKFAQSIDSLKIACEK